MSDGYRLAARIWLPDDAEVSPVPAILEYIPYRKRDFTRARDEPMHYYFAGYGYAAVRVDLRGSGDSDGLLLDEYTNIEHDDAVEIIRWLASQPWCSGAVGMMGISWGGSNSLQVASRQPPELKSIVTLCSTDDRYANDAHYMGGCLLNENLTWGSVLLTYNAYPPDPALVGARWREIWLDRLEHAVLFPEVWLKHQQRDAYWKHGSVCENYNQIACPVYAIGGWADAYSNAIPRLLARLQVPRKGLIGPWAHAFPHDGVPGPTIGFLQEVLRWWDHWLKGIDTGIMDEPMLRVWMQDSVSPRPFYDERPGRWVAECAWPAAHIVARRYTLAPGKLGDEGAPETALAFHCPQTVGLAAGDWCTFGAGGALPTDQHEDDGKSLTFDSERLSERLEILGAPVATLELAVDRPCGLIALRLNDVGTDGASTRVTYGLRNLTHHVSHENPKPLTPGRRYQVSVKLNDMAYSFPPGHRIRLAVSTTYWPVVWPSPEPVTLTIFTGKSYLELPIRLPRPEDAELAPFMCPEQAPPLEYTKLRPVPFERSIERDPATDETVYTIFSDGGDLDGAALARLNAIGLDVGYMILKRFRIREHDPLSAKAEIIQSTLLRRDDWLTRIETHTRFSATKKTFRLRAELTAYEGSELAFSRRWNQVISRVLV